VSGRVKPIGNWLYRAKEAITNASIQWIRLIICIWIIVSWVVVSCLRVFTCLVDVCISGYTIVCNGMINYFSTIAYSFRACLYVLCVVFLLLRWSSIYWCEQMRELPVVIRVMEVSLLSLSWVWFRFPKFPFSPCIVLLLEHLFWILLNFFLILLLASWCALVFFLSLLG